MAAMQKLENPNNLAALLQGGSQLLSLFSPQKKTTGGSTETTATNMSLEGLDAVLRQILESNQGLASVARGQRQAGLFNSSTNTLLTNDLITRASGEVAKINAPTTRITSPRTDRTDAPLSPGKSLGTLVASSLINNALKSDTAKNFGSSIANSIAGSLKGNKNSGWMSGFDLPMGDMGGGASALDLGSLISGSNSGWVSGFDIGGGGSFMSPSASGPGLAEAKAIYDIFTSEDPGASAERAVGTAVGNYFGGPIGGAIGGAVAEPVFEAGYDILGGVEQLGGNLIEGVGDLISGVFGGGCFITTATVKLMGKDDDCEELTTLRAFRDSWLKENHPEDIQAYYDTAPKILDALSSLDSAEEILRQAYALYIIPAVEAIKEGDNEEAYSLYRNMVLMLSKAAGLTNKKVTE